MKPAWFGVSGIALGFLISLVSAAAEAGEQQWSKLPTAPYMLNNKQDALAFAGSGIGWYGNGTGQVYRTTDIGEHWKAVWKSRGTYVRALEFIDEKTGFLGNVGPGYFPDVTDKRPLYVTRDGGEHWSPIAPTAAEIVEDAGFEVVEAATADEAITVLETRNDIRLIFTDIQMPGSIDGLRLAHLVKARWPPVQIIATSVRLRLREDDLPKGGRYLSKPYAVTELTQTLKELIPD